MKLEQIGKYALWIIGANMVYKLIKRGNGQVDIPTDPGSSTGVLSFTLEEAQTIANRLYYAMADIGTNEDLLFDSLKNLTAQQLIMVYNAFGTRSYAFSGNWFGLGYPLDLFGWFNQELSGNDLNNMKQLWAKTGLIWTI